MGVCRPGRAAQAWPSVPEGALGLPQSRPRLPALDLASASLGEASGGPFPGLAPVPSNSEFPLSATWTQGADHPLSWGVLCT